MKLTNFKIWFCAALVGTAAMMYSNNSQAGIATDVAEAQIQRLTAICEAATEAAAMGLTTRGVINVLSEADNLSAAEKSLYITCYDKQIDIMLGRGKM